MNLVHRAGLSGTKRDQPGATRRVRTRRIAVPAAVAILLACGAGAVATTADASLLLPSAGSPSTRAMAPGKTHGWRP